MSCCSKIGEIFKKILKALRPILVIALTCFAAYMLIFAGPAAVAALEGFMTFLPSVMVGLEASTWGYLALGAAVLIDPKTAGEVIGGVVEGVAGIAGTVIASVATGVGTGLFGEGGFGKVLMWGGLAYLGYLFFTADSDDKEEDPPDNGSERQSGASNPENGYRTKQPAGTSNLESSYDESFTYTPLAA